MLYSIYFLSVWILGIYEIGDWTWYPSWDYHRGAESRVSVRRAPVRFRVGRWVVAYELLVFVPRGGWCWWWWLWLILMGL
jgi:hypothetical protein